MRIDFRGPEKEPKLTTYYKENARMLRFKFQQVTNVPKRTVYVFGQPIVLQLIQFQRKISPARKQERMETQADQCVISERVSVPVFVERKAAFSFSRVAAC